jgi:hypothetical protein
MDTIRHAPSGLHRRSWSCAVLNHVDGAAARRQAWSASLNTIGIQAAWRLGLWDRVAEYLESAEPEPHFEVRHLLAKSAAERIVCEPCRFAHTVDCALRQPTGEELL